MKLECFMLLSAFYAFDVGFSYTALLLSLSACVSVILTPVLCVCMAGGVENKEEKHISALFDASKESIIMLITCSCKQALSLRNAFMSEDHLLAGLQ